MWLVSKAALNNKFTVQGKGSDRERFGEHCCRSARDTRPERRAGKALENVG